MALQIRAISSPADVKKFIKSQWNFYKGDKYFVPPIIADRQKLLDTKKNPFYKHSQMQLFLAERNGEVVGRIAAIINDNHNIIHEDKVGFFGFFECVNEQEVAGKLLETAAAWLRERGMTEIRGPVNPSMNDEAGLLVEGFDSMPVILMTYNPPYYAELIEKAGFRKEKDLYAYYLKEKEFASEKMLRLQGLIRERYKLSFRGVDFKNKAQFKKDIQLIKDLYNAAWEKNWGFVKMTEEEFDFLAADLKQIADPDLVVICYSGDRPVGFALALPDINRAIVYNKGGSLLGALWHLLTKKKRINLSRIIVLGVLPEFRSTGIDAVLYYEIGTRSIKNGMVDGEASWILEDNVMMNRALHTTMKGEHYKTYRIYQKSL